MKNFKLLLALLLSAPLLKGCSVGMALSGEKDPDLSVVREGTSRAEVEFQLGQPVEVNTKTPGKTSAKYQYTLGNDPSAGRAIAHGAMDVLTFGVWEIVGTPVEAINGKNYEVWITYNDLDKIEHIGRG